MSSLSTLTLPDSIAPKAAAPDDLPGLPISITVVRSLEALREHVPAWNRLAETAIEPNVFYEPWMLLPALRYYPPGEEMSFVLVYAHRRKHPQGPPVLCGFFPLVRRKLPGGLSAPCLSLWQYVHCFLSTPLVRTDFVAPVLQAFFDWLAHDPLGAPLVELPGIAADGPLHTKLLELLWQRGNTCWTARRHVRAMLRRAETGEQYIHQSMDRKRRHDATRRRRRLAELGHLESMELGSPAGDEVDSWIDEFLALEARGWKGRSQTALGCGRQDRGFFRDIVRQAAEQSRLMMLSLRFDGAPIAMKCNFLAADGGFAFKIAYDEQFSQHSPGVLLELDNIRSLHQRPETIWFDSCADPGHPMIDRLWNERRPIETLFIATGRAPGDLIVSLLPALRWAKRQVARRRQKADKNLR